MNGSVHEFYRLKARQIRELMLVLARIRHEPNMSSNNENADKPMTTNCNAETKTTDVEKIKNLREQNIEGEANNMQSEEEDSQRGNLNSNLEIP